MTETTVPALGELPATLGSTHHPPLEPAPGAYLLDRVPPDGPTPGKKRVPVASGRR